MGGNSSVVTLGAPRLLFTSRDRPGEVELAFVKACFPGRKKWKGCLRRERVAFQDWQEEREKATFTKPATIGRASCDVQRLRPKGVSGQPRGKEAGKTDRHYPKYGTCRVWYCLGFLFLTCLSFVS